MALTRITKGVIKPNENYDTHDINSTGIITATGLNVSGNASIGGVLTYEDVTNIDSIGIITARSDIKVGTAVTITSAGAGFYAGIVTASDFVKRDGSGFGAASHEYYLTHIDASGNPSASGGNMFGGYRAGGEGGGNTNNITTGENNHAIGYECGEEINSGNYNTLFGHSAGTNIRNGNHNVAMGYETLIDIRQNHANVALGSNALRNLNGYGNYSFNVAIGYYALREANQAAYNVGVGQGVGASLSNGDRNTFLGTQAGGTGTNDITTGSNNTLLGNQAQATSATVSNEVTIGNSSVNHLRIPGIGVSFSTNGNHISGVTTFTGEIHGDGQRLGSLTNSKRFSGLFLTNGNSYYGTNKLFVADGNGFGLDAYGSNDSWLKANSGGGTAGDCWMKTGGSGGHIIAKGVGAVELHHAGQSDKKLETTATGAVVTGILTATSFSGDGSNITNVSASFTTDAQFNLVAGEDAGSNFSGTSAQKNILLGHDAGKRITTGDNNIAIGDEALAASDGGNITGSGNIAIGRQAMRQRAVTGDCNIIIGDNRAGRLLTSGSHNIGMGQYSLHYMETGTGNIAIGYACLDYAQGTGNVAIGYNSGTEVHGTGSSGSYNTLYGYGAGSSLSSGSNCIIIGKDAQASSNSVSDEITLGNSSITKFRIPGINVVLKDNGGTPTQGHVLTVDANGEASFVAASGGGGGGGSSLSSDSAENTIGGSDAGLNLNTSSSYRNTLFGYQAGEQINSGDDNTCIGWKAADKLTNGSKNVAVGSEALEYITSGSDNVAIGWEAGRSLTSGQGNTMIGNMAGRSMSGNDNIAIGDHAYSNGGGTRTIGIGGESVWLGGTDVIGIGKFTMARGGSQEGGIGIGYYAGRNNAGDHNVYLGYEAGYGTGSSPYSTGGYNISLGYRSLYNISTGEQNIAIGSMAGDVLTTGTNNIIIGDSADASSATVSNEITIGDANITKFRIPGLNSFEISDAGVLSGTASAATSANGFRNVTVSTASPSGGSDGDVWIKYS